VYDTAGDVINTVAAEVGLTPVTDPFASTDPAFIQLATLCTSAGRELLGLHLWQRLLRTHTFTTTVSTTEPLPAGFVSMIDQTYWDQTNQFPLAGPLSPQTWAYVKYGLLASGTVYVSFRVAEGVIQMLPDPMTPGLTISFEYVSDNWVLEADGVTYDNEVQASDETILFDQLLITKFLKLRFLEAKGFDTSAAMDQFKTAFMQVTGRDVSAPVLSMARRPSFPYLGLRNVPETGYGS